MPKIASIIDTTDSEQFDRRVRTYESDGKTVKDDSLGYRERKTHTRTVALEPGAVTSLTVIGYTHKGKEIYVDTAYCRWSPPTAGSEGLWSAHQITPASVKVSGYILKKDGTVGKARASDNYSLDRTVNHWTPLAPQWVIDLFADLLEAREGK